MSYKNLHLTKPRIVGLAFGLALTLQAFVPFLVPSSSAATLTKAQVRLNRLAAGVDSPWELDFKPATSGATTLSVNFSSAWTTNSGTISATQAVGACNDSADTTLPGAPVASGSGSTISITSGMTALSNTTQYCEAFTTSNSVHTPTAGAYTFTVTVGSDSGTVATTIVGAGADQINVTATVNPTFSMTLVGPSGQNDALGTLTTGAVSTSQSPFILATISTNAANGYTLWGKDGNTTPGLHSTTASYDIKTNCSGTTSTNSTVTLGTEGFNLGATVVSGGGTGAGTPSVTTAFDGTVSHHGGGLCNSAYQAISTSTGTANGDVVTMKNNAAISGLTKPATDYSDVQTFVGAGLF
jgi:hypothetical protein